MYVQLKERRDMIASYQKLEHVVISHLSNLRKAIEEPQPVNYV